MRNKKGKWILLFSLFTTTLPFIGCGGDDDDGGDDDTAAEQCTGVLSFKDANLEAAVRDAIQKPTGDLFTSDVAFLTELDASGRKSHVVQSRRANLLCHQSL